MRTVWLSPIYSRAVLPAAELRGGGGRVGGRGETLPTAGAGGKGFARLASARLSVCRVFVPLSVRRTRRPALRLREQITRVLRS